jgi:hypothetical protein
MPAASRPRPADVVQVRAFGVGPERAVHVVGERDAEPPVPERGQVLGDHAGGALVVDIHVDEARLGVEVHAHVRQVAAADGVHARVARRHAVDDEAVDQRLLDQLGPAGLDPRHEREAEALELAAGRDAVQELH